MRTRRQKEPMSTTVGRDTGQAPAPQRVELAIGGMTCASCAARIERTLNKLDGVTAAVNYATEKAQIEYAPSVSTADLIKVINDTGYTATLPKPAAAQEDSAQEVGEDGYDEHTRSLRQRMRVSLLLGVPVIALSMVPPLQFTYWQWLALTLAAPVAVWGAWPFHRAALANLRHGTATMDTLISLGVLAAFGWSLYALFLGGAGHEGMHHGFSLTVERGSAGQNIYLEVASGLTAAILAGRFFEARAKRRAGPSVAGACWRWAPRTSRFCGATTSSGSRSTSSASATGSWCGPGRRSPPTASSLTGTSAIDASMLTGESVPVEVGPGDPVVGGDRQCRGPAGRARDPRRLGHPTGADGQAGRRRPERKGRDPTARRPDLGGVRADRHRARRGHLRGLARLWARARRPHYRPRSRC